LKGVKRGSYFGLFPFTQLGANSSTAWAKGLVLRDVGTFSSFRDLGLSFLPYSGLQEGSPEIFLCARTLRFTGFLWVRAFFLRVCRVQALVFVNERERGCFQSLRFSSPHFGWNFLLGVSWGEGVSRRPFFRFGAHPGWFGRHRC